MSDTKNALGNAEKIISAIDGVVRILAPLGSGERGQVIQGALVVLREPNLKTATTTSQSSSEDTAGLIALPPKARIWMKTNAVEPESLDQVFDISEGVATLMASEVSGKNNSEKTIKAYVLAGVAGLLSSGEPNFTDKAARGLCEHLGCYDSTNHSKYMKDKGAYFVGDKDKGWKLTGPGQKFGASVVKQLAEASNA